MSSLRINEFVANLDGSSEVSGSEQSIIDSLNQLLPENINRDSEAYYHEAHGYLAAKIGPVNNFSQTPFDSRIIERLASDLRGDVSFEIINRERQISPQTQIEKFNQISFPNANGEEISLGSFFNQEGQDLVLFSFGGTWCGACMQQLPQRIELHEKYPNITIVEIAMENKDDYEKGMKDKIHPEYPVLFDPVGKARETTMVASQGVPHSMLFKNDGTFLDAMSGSGQPRPAILNPLEEYFVQEYLPESPE